MDYKNEYKFPPNITLVITNNCNLACKYCFVNQDQTVMDLEMAKKAIDIAFQNFKYHQNNNTKISHKKKFQIFFFGGEPLLYWDKLIKPCIIYSKNKYKNEVSFAITTNGTLLFKDRIDFLLQYNTEITVSFDGDMQTQNYNRPQHNGKGSFDLIINNVKYLLLKSPFSLIRSTIYKHSVTSLFENYKFFYNLGVKNYSFVLDTTSEQWDDNDILNLEKELNQISYFRIQLILNGKIPMYSNGFEALLRDCYSTVQNYTNLNQIKKNRYKIFNENKFFHCGIGVVSFVVNTNGDIYGCVCQVTNKKTNNIFLIGNINNNPILDETKHKKLLEFYDKMMTPFFDDNNEQCQDCLYNKLCYQRSYCLSIGYDLNAINKNLPTKVSCKLSEIIYRNSFIELSLLSYFSEYNNLKEYIINILKNKIKNNLTFKYKSNQELTNTSMLKYLSPQLLINKKEVINFWDDILLKYQINSINFNFYTQKINFLNLDYNKYLKILDSFNLQKFIENNGINPILLKYIHL